MATIHPLQLRLVAINPPFDPAHGVLFRLQSRDVEDPKPAVRTTAFNISIGIEHLTGGKVDFKGDFVHGKKSDRFLYLCWGTGDGTDPFVMFARAKIRLSDVPHDLLERALEQRHVLVCDLQATNSKGQPATGTINAPAASWHVDSEPGR